MTSSAETIAAGTPQSRWLSEVPADWDRWLADAGTEASFTQTSHWALSHHLVNGAEPYVVEVTQAGRRVAGALLGHVRDRSGTMSGALKSVIGGYSAGWLECHAGPVIIAPSAAPALAVLLQETERLSNHLGVRRVRFSTPPSLGSWLQQPGIADVFRRQRYVSSPWATSIVDITKPDDALLAGFNASARKGIRRCHALNIAVTDCRQAADIESKFLKPYIATRRALGMSERTAVEVPWLESESDPSYRFLTAEDPAGTVLGTLGTRRWNGIVTEIYSERMMSARESKVPVQDLLHWHAFVMHRELGDRWFDLAGFNPEPADDKERGIRSFKEKWGGRIVLLSQFETGSPPLAYRLLRDLNKRLRRNSP